MNKGKDVILVTGATGRQGGAVVRHLLDHGRRIRIMTRRPDSEPARALAERGAEVAYGDYDRPESLASPLDGVWGVFSVQNTWEAGVEREEEQGKRFARLAREAGVQHFVYTSVGSADRRTGIPHFENKWRIEETVRSLDFPSHTILRSVFFMENWISPWFKPGLEEGELRIGIPANTSLQIIAVDDIGWFGAKAFTDHVEMAGREIDIAGDERTMAETAEILSRAMGRPIRFVQVPIEEVRKASEDYAVMLEWFERVGYDVDIAALEEEYGIQLTRLPDWAARVDWSVDSSS